MQTVIAIAALPGALAGPAAAPVEEGERFAAAFLTLVAAPQEGTDAVSGPLPDPVQAEGRSPLPATPAPMPWPMTAAIAPPLAELVVPVLSKGDMPAAAEPQAPGDAAAERSPGEKDVAKAALLDPARSAPGPTDHLPPMAVVGMILPVPVLSMIPPAVASPAMPEAAPTVPAGGSAPPPGTSADPDAPLPASPPVPRPLVWSEADPLPVAGQDLHFVSPARQTGLAPVPAEAAKTPVLTAGPVTPPPLAPAPAIAGPVPGSGPAVPPIPVVRPERPIVAPEHRSPERVATDQTTPATRVLARDMNLVLPVQAPIPAGPIGEQPTAGPEQKTPLPVPPKAEPVAEAIPVAETASVAEVEPTDTAVPTPQKPKAEAVDLPVLPSLSLWQGQFVPDEPPEPLPAALEKLASPMPGVTETSPPFLSLRAGLAGPGAEPTAEVRPRPTHPPAQSARSLHAEAEVLSPLPPPPAPPSPVALAAPSPPPQLSEDGHDVPLSEGPLPLAAPLSPLPPSFSAASAAPVPQLAAQIVESLARKPDGTTEFTLAPEELGRVRIVLQADAQNPDRMVVMLSFDRPETLDLFRRHTDQLVEAIRAAGYSGVDISFGQQGAGSTGSGSERQGSVETAALSVPADLPRPEPRPPRLASSSSLDLRL